MNIFRDLIGIMSMLLVTGVLVMCIANNLDSGIIYSGLVIISGLGGYSVGRIITKK